MRNGARRSGEPTTSPRSASLDDTYLSTPMKRGPRKTHSRMAVRFSVPCKVSFTGEQIYSTMKGNKLARKAVRKT